MGSVPSSLINISFHGAQPFVAGQQITGVVMFNNTLERCSKVQRIYAEFLGEVIYSVKSRNGYDTSHVTFFQQLINLEEEQVRKLL